MSINKNIFIINLKFIPLFFSFGGYLNFDLHKNHLKIVRIQVLIGGVFWSPIVCISRKLQGDDVVGPWTTRCVAKLKIL